MNTQIECKICGSSNVNVTFQQTSLKTKDVSLLRKLARIFLILTTFGLWLLVPKPKANTKVNSDKVAICQNCGNSWKLKR